FRRRCKRRCVGSDLTWIGSKKLTQVNTGDYRIAPQQQCIESAQPALCPTACEEVSMTRYVIPFNELRMSDVDQVGGKNASLGEMISQLPDSVRVPGGFATTAQAYRDFLAHQGLAERIQARLAALDVDDVVELAKVGAEIRGWIVDTPFPPKLEQE